MGSLFGADNDSEYSASSTTISAGVSGDGNRTTSAGNRSIGAGADTVLQNVRLGRDASLTINDVSSEALGMAHALAITGFNAAGTVAMAGIDAANRGAALATAGVNAGAAIALNANENLRDIGGLALASGVQYAQVNRDIFSDAAGIVASSNDNNTDLAIRALQAGQNNLNSVLDYTEGFVTRQTNQQTQLVTQQQNLTSQALTNTLAYAQSTNDRLAMVTNAAVQAAQTTALNATPVSEGAYAQTQAKEFNKLVMLTVGVLVAIYLVRNSKP